MTRVGDTQLTSLEVVFRRRLTQIPLEGDGERVGLARSVTLPIVGGLFLARLRA